MVHLPFTMVRGPSSRVGRCSPIISISPFSAGSSSFVCMLQATHGVGYTTDRGLGAGLECTHPRLITIFAFLLVSTSSWIRENGGSSSQDNGRELLRKLSLQVCTLQQTSLSSTLSYSRLPILQICIGFLLTLFFGRRGCLLPYLGIQAPPSTFPL